MDAVLTPGSCDAASLVALLLAAIAAALLVVRLPGSVLITFLPAVLLPAWLMCGSLALVDIALVASLGVAAWRTHDTRLTVLHGVVALAGVVLGALVGGVASVGLASLDDPFRTLLVGGAFLAGYALGEAAAIAVMRRQNVPARVWPIPHSSIWANLLLLFPAVVLTNVMVARGTAYFIPMLLVFVLALGLIALYLSASTARESVLYERAQAVAAATGGMDVPPEIIEERAMELTHELRSPLTAILGYAGLLAKHQAPDPAVEEAYVESIASSSNYMLRLVNNILDLQRLESGRQPVQLRPVEVDRVLEEALAATQPAVDEKGINTTLSIEPGLPSVITDELLLRRAVDNLLSNAVKYTRPGDHIRLSAAREGEGVAISVADTGIGLTREERDRLFERFFRGRRSEARIERGTGLGLALVREAMRQLNGEVRVESTLGEGSTFTLWLPTPEGSSPLPLAEADATPKARAADGTASE